MAFAFSPISQVTTQHVLEPLSVLGQLKRIGCSLCHLYFDSMDSLKAHFVSSPQVHKATCPDCLQDFHDLQGLRVSFLSIRIAL